jgi:hypothetical protein
MKTKKIVKGLVTVKKVEVSNEKVNISVNITEMCEGCDCKGFSCNTEQIKFCIAYVVNETIKNL